MDEPVYLNYQQVIDFIISNYGEDGKVMIRDAEAFSASNRSLTILLLKSKDRSVKAEKVIEVIEGIGYIQARNIARNEELISAWQESQKIHDRSSREHGRDEDV